MLEFVKPLKIYLFKETNEVSFSILVSPNSVNTYILKVTEFEKILELWDKKPSDGGVCVKKVYPTFNRMIIFGTSKDSWHGHPTPLNCPDGEYRKSLATYYYSSEHGDDLEIHSTVY